MKLHQRVLWLVCFAMVAAVTARNVTAGDQLAVVLEFGGAR